MDGGGGVKSNDPKSRHEAEQPAGSALPLRLGNVLVGWTALAAGAATALLPGAAARALALAAGSLAVLLVGGWLARPAERHMGQRLDRLRQALGELLGEVSGASSGLAADARTLRDGAAQQSALASRQAAAVVETGTTATEIAQTAKAAMAHAEEVLQVAQRADELSAEGQLVLERTVETIRSLADEVGRLSTAIAESARRSRHIGEIVGGLKDLAENTNLLAINASIEAVKAGDEGRGFAVVAAEMGNLAELSLSSANEVRGILQEIEQGTRTAMQVAEQGTQQARGAMDLAAEAGQAIAGLTSALRDSSVAARQIANNTRQQGIGVEQIVAALGEMSSAARDAVEGTLAVERATASLADLSKRLDTTVARFRAQESA
jgi:methyl-accepting chemotaxis protein